MRANRAIAACRSALTMQNTCWLTDVELVPTGTVFTPGDRVGAASSTDIADSSPKYVTCETADSLLHRSLPIVASALLTSNRVMPFWIDGSFDSVNTRGPPT